MKIKFLAIVIFLFCGNVFAMFGRISAKQLGQISTVFMNTGIAGGAGIFAYKTREGMRSANQEMQRAQDDYHAAREAMRASAVEVPLVVLNSK